MLLKKEKYIIIELQKYISYIVILLIKNIYLMIHIYFIYYFLISIKFHRFEK